MYLLKEIVFLCVNNIEPTEYQSHHCGSLLDSL